MRQIVANSMIDFKEIPYTDDTWELFARDFLTEMGFYVESTPDRGPDQGKDLLIVRPSLSRLKINSPDIKLKWLVGLVEIQRLKERFIEKRQRPHCITLRLTCKRLSVMRYHPACKAVAENSGGSHRERGTGVVRLHGRDQPADGEPALRLRDASD